MPEGLVILMTGTTGSGKSRCAAALAERLDGCRLLRTCDVRRELGLAEAGGPTPPDHFAAQSPARQGVYDEIVRRLPQTGGGRGGPVILDGAYETADKRSAVYAAAARAGRRVVCLFCHCPRPVALARIAGRRERGEAADEAADPAVLAHIESEFDYPFADRGAEPADLNTHRMLASGEDVRPPIREALTGAGFAFAAPRPRVGLDFDGVIADTYEGKKRYAAAHYGVQLTTRQCNRAEGMERLGRERYRRMIRDLYGTELTMSLEPMPGAAEALAEMDGFADCYVITARHDHEVAWLRRWADEHRLAVHGIAHTREQSKRQAVAGLGLAWFFDDAMRNLTDLDVPGLRLGLFAHGDSPEAQAADDPRVAMVRSWDEIVSLTRAGR